MTDTPIAERDVIRPTMSPVLEEPGNKGTKVLMVEGPGGEPSPPEPPSEPLATVWGAQWVTKDPFIAYSTAIAKTAEFSGGIAPVTYRYRLQQRLTGGDGTISNGDWNDYNNTPVEISVALPAAGYDVRFQSQATDADESKNEFTGWKQVQPQTTIGTIGFLVNGIEAVENAVAAVSGSVINVDCTTTGGNATDLTYSWRIRSGNASFVSSTTNKTCSVSLGNDYPGMVLVQCDIRSATSSNSPASDILTVVLAEGMTVSIPKAY